MFDETRVFWWSWAPWGPGVETGRQKGAKLHQSVTRFGGHFTILSAFCGVCFFRVFSGALVFRTLGGLGAQRSRNGLISGRFF